MIIKFLFDSIFPSTPDFSEMKSSGDTPQSSIKQIGDISLSTLSDRGLLKKFSGIYENTKLIDRSISSGESITATFIDTYEETDKGEKTKDKGSVYMIDIGATLFKTAILLKPDQKDSLFNHIIGYFAGPFVIIFFIIRVRFDGDNIMELLQELLSPYGINEYFFLFLILILVGYIGGRIASNNLRKGIISVENQFFEKYFDIQSEDELGVREFFDPYRLQILAERIDSTPRQDDRKIVFIENIIAVFISHRKTFEKSQSSDAHPYLGVIQDDIQHVEGLLEKLEIVSYTEKHT